MRRLGATILVLEALVIALAIPVAITVSDATPETAGGVGGGLAAGCVLLAGLLRFRWAFIAGTILQIMVIMTGFIVPVMFFLGTIFCILWCTAIWLGWRVESAQTR